MLSVRRATVQDIPLIIDLANQVWPQTYSPIISEAQVAYMMDMMYSQAALQQQMEGQHHFIIVYDGEMPIGYASYDDEGNGVYKLHKIYVALAGQGKGAGSSMIEFVADEIKAEGAKELRLNVNRENIAAQAFYKKLGFDVIGEEDIDIGNGFLMTDYTLALPLELWNPANK